MINDIISGIATALDAEFGDGYTIYAEYVEQGFNAPCFYIKLPGARARKGRALACI